MARRRFAIHSGAVCCVRCVSSAVLHCCGPAGEAGEAEEASPSCLVRPRTNKNSKESHS